MKKILFFLGFILNLISLNAQNDVLLVQSISQNDPTIIGLRQKAATARSTTSNFTKQNWAEAKIATYKNGLKAILIPVIGSTNERGLVSMTFIKEKGEVSETFILEIIPEKNPQSNELRNLKKATFYTMDGTKIHHADYRDNKLLKITNTSEASNTQKVRWRCLGQCLMDIYPKLPTTIKVACAASCVTCISQVWIACVPCAACLIVPAIPCLMLCTY